MAISDEIFLSRDNIRSQIIDKLKDYLELENVDLTKSSFLSFIIDILSTLTSNIFFYQSNVYREFFLTQAKLPESIYNLSAFLGYSPPDANYATANLLLTFPLSFTDPDTNIFIPENFEFKSSDGISFRTYYDTEITVDNNAAVEIKSIVDGRVYYLPVNIDTTANMEFEFVLPVRQYKLNTQEFQIDSDLQLYQFTDIEVPLTGQIAGIEVYVRGPNQSPSASGTLYTEFQSIYLMSSTDYGYVVRKSINGRKIYFGNGIIGIQPAAGSTIIVNILETEGSRGNVISSSITQAERLYCDQNGINTIVNYDIINASPAFGGADEESIQDIRSNSISSLTSLNRLVSESDFQNLNLIIRDLPLAQNAIPILKRSDLKVNEIQLYVTAYFGDDIIPTVNGWHSMPITKTNIARGEIINYEGTDFINIFDIDVDLLNSSGSYTYTTKSIELVPTLVQSWEHESQDPYHFHANKMIVNKYDSTSSIELEYYSQESDVANLECTIRFLEGGTINNMTNYPSVNGGKFKYIFNNNDIPTGTINAYFKISNPTLPYLQDIAEYQSSFIFKQDLKNIMLSNVTIDSTTTITVYDIPLVKASYYNGLSADSKKDFEVEVLQKLLSSLELADYRMLTDFINIKFCNTTGVMDNMLYNETTKSNVIDVGISTLPISPTNGDRYIIGTPKSGNLAPYPNYIATCIDSTNNTWFYTEPTINDMVYSSTHDTKFLFTQEGWSEPVYEIPLQILVEVVRDIGSSSTEGRLIQDIKDALVDAFSSRFGPQLFIYKSELIDVIQSVSGVLNCRIVKPESSIFFNYNISNFTQEQLLKYSPEWIYFTEDDISVRIITE